MQREDQDPVKRLQGWEQILDRISAHFENNNFGDYVSLLQRPVRLILINFLGGVGRGVGIGLGFTVVAAIIILVLNELTHLQLPVIGRFIAEVVKIVQAELHTPTI